MTPQQQQISVEGMQQSYHDQIVYLSSQLAIKSGLLSAAQAELAIEKSKNEKPVQEKK